MDFKSIRNKLPSSPFHGATRDSRVPITENVRMGFAGPTTPNLGVNAPHQDLGVLVTGFIGDLQGAGEKISEVLDKPFNATVGIPGPHRLVGGFLDSGTGVARDVIGKITGT